MAPPPGPRAASTARKRENGPHTMRPLVVALTAAR